MAASCTHTADWLKTLSINVEASREAGGRSEVLFDRLNKLSINNKARRAPFLLAVDAPRWLGQAGGGSGSGRRSRGGRDETGSGPAAAAAPGAARAAVVAVPALPAPRSCRCTGQRRPWGPGGVMVGSGAVTAHGVAWQVNGTSGEATGDCSVPAERRPDSPGNPLSSSRGLHSQGVGAARWDRDFVSRCPGPRYDRAFCAIREPLHLGGRGLAGGTIGFMSLRSDFGTRSRARREPGMGLC